MKKIALLLVLFILHAATARAANEYVLRTDPAVAGASVFVDGSFAGTTDDNGKMVVTGEPGAHQVRVDYENESFTAEMAFDADLNTLPPFRIGPSNNGHESNAQQLAAYTIDTNLAGATISVPGEAPVLTNSAGRAFLRLTVGQQYSIEVAKNGYAPQSVTIRVPPSGGFSSITLQQVAESHVDLILIALVALLAISIGLLLIVAVRRRRTALPHMVTGMNVPITNEQNGGHFDRYRLLGPLGSGGVATIYRAIDLADKNLVALKVLDTRWLSDPDMVRKFLAEGEALRAITQRDNNAAVVRCHRYGREHDSLVGRPFIALELLEGETLQARLAREPILEEATCIAIGYQIAAALIPVHDAGIVHRDLTPDNIFLRKGEVLVRGRWFSNVPVVVLIDFGIARQELMSRMTMDGSIAGKPHFMSPEQCRGAAVDARSDLYSAGIILFLMATGRLPFAGRDPFEVMRAQQGEEPPRLPPHVNKSYADLCVRLLQKDRDARPASAVVAASELAELFLAIGTATPINVVSLRNRRLSQ
jgi:hypothetical protein